MKITRLKIQNYKSIHEGTISELSKVNMIFGHNNSGKSNVLKFVDLIFKPKIQTDESPSYDKSRVNVRGLQAEASAPFWQGIIANHPFIFRNNNWNEPILFEVDVEVGTIFFSKIKNYAELNSFFFKDTDVKVTIKGKITGLDVDTSQIALEEVLINDTIVFKNDPQEYFGTIKSAEDLQGIKDKGFEIIPDLLNTFSNSVLLLDNDRYFQPEIEDSNDELELKNTNFINWFHNLSMNNERHSEYVGILKDIAKFAPSGDAEFKASETNSPFKNFKFDFYRAVGEIHLMLTNDRNERLPLQNFGTGIQQILFILAKIAEKKPKIVLIEELELNLSPKYQAEFINHLLLKYIQETDCELKQLFFTTHSPLLCYRSDFKIYNVKIEGGGKTEVKKLGNIQEVISSFYSKEVKDFFVEQNAQPVGAK